MSFDPKRFPVCCRKINLVFIVTHRGQGVKHMLMSTVQGLKKVRGVVYKQK